MIKPLAGTFWKLSARDDYFDAADPLWRRHSDDLTADPVFLLHHLPFQMCPIAVQDNCY